MTHIGISGTLDNLDLGAGVGGGGMVAQTTKKLPSRTVFPTMNLGVVSTVSFCSVKMAILLDYIKFFFGVIQK